MFANMGIVTAIEAEREEDLVAFEGCAGGYGTSNESERVEERKRQSLLDEMERIGHASLVEPQNRR